MLPSGGSCIDTMQEHEDFVKYEHQVIQQVKYRYAKAVTGLSQMHEARIVGM